jgi:hypothetical protein
MCMPWLIHEQGSPVMMLMVIPEGLRADGVHAMAYQAT